ncbi:hypothetical protein [Staphylococcus chromogenes]|uniref:hypothetical protein n=1 Tax=Staphylococcus chromogenes TaxID=46126 RepID=UPI0028FEC01C|nr:hypothetical protein [Staphylococcus chromogenes]MDU0452556.1 hypothetical protein [Staphylococcus chromogenes]
MKGTLIDNNSSNLTIVFQSAGRISIELFDKILEGKALNSEVKQAHEKYTWFKFSKDNYSDYYYIEDYYSESYGWYMFDKGRSIFEEINQDITELIKNRNYINVTTYGSSKGGTAALLFGLINPLINNVFSLVPQIHVIKYIDKKLPKYKKLFFPEENKEIENYFEEIFFNEDLYLENNIKNTNLFFYTGINDEQFDDLLKLFHLLEKKNINNNIIINSSFKKHNDIVMDNVPFIKSALKIITLQKIMQGPRLRRITSNVLLLKDKYKY